MSLLRVNLIRPGALGDTIVLMPAAQALKAAYPQVHITLIGSLFASELREMMPCVDDVRRLDSTEMLPLFAPVHATPSPALAGLLEADLTLAFLHDADRLRANWRRLGGGRFEAFTPEPPPEGGRHISELLCRATARAAGLAAGPPPLPRLVVPEWAVAEAKAWLDGPGGRPARPPIAVQPGSGSRAKCWPPERFGALIARLTSELGRAVVVLAGPADEEAVAALPGAPVARELPLAVVGGILRACACALVNDSGPGHLSAALGVRTLAIFGPTSAAQWAPRGEAVRILTGTASCAPCSRDARNACTHRQCLTAIGADTVYDRVASMIAL